MKVNKTTSTSKYVEQRQSNNKYGQSSRQAKKSDNKEDIPFSEILKKVKQNTYFQ